jgi:sn-glycerol 3-phosphate transport system permease protein
MNKVGINWDPSLNGNHALFLIILSASWKQISYNFLFYLASLQSIPKSLLEAASIDGASPLRRFIDITIPMISPTTFFLFIMNLIYTFFDTFGIIFTTTQGGPGYSTTNLVYKVYVDGIVNLNLGSSAAQSVILMIFVSFITILHFRFVEKKVHY